jgi:hypothetical protein
VVGGLSLSPTARSILDDEPTSSACLISVPIVPSPLTNYDGHPWAPTTCDSVILNGLDGRFKRV